ncbi:MAG: PIG-L deacetylase family protein [Trueperaceae bacterium]
MVDLCLIVPHPDDEVFGSGGLIRRMTEHGKRVVTITLTRGGAGRTLGLCNQEELPERREQELLHSLAALGVPRDDSYIFDYPDFVTAADRGMDPRPGLQGVDHEEITCRLVTLLDRLQPRTLLTFPPNGANGHPDHVTTHNLARSALNRTALQPQELYYFASERPYAGPVPPGFLASEEIAGMHLPPTHYVELDWEVEAKLRAMAQHETQARSVLMYMRRFARRLLVESFHRAMPAANAELVGETVYWL